MAAAVRIGSDRGFAVWKIAATPGLVAIGCMIPVSGWWIIQLSGHLEKHSPAIGNVSLQAILAILLLQFLSVSLFSPYWAAESHEQSPHRFAFVQTGVSVISSVLPAWPLLAMLSLASGVSASIFGKAEAVVLATGITIALIARSFQELNFRPEITRLSQSFLGLVAATLVWVFRFDWFHWIGL